MQLKRELNPNQFLMLKNVFAQRSFQGHFKYVCNSQSVQYNFDSPRLLFVHVYLWEDTSHMFHMCLKSMSM